MEAKMHRHGLNTLVDDDGDTEPERMPIKIIDQRCGLSNFA